MRRLRLGLCLLALCACGSEREWRAEDSWNEAMSQARTPAPLADEPAARATPPPQAGEQLRLPRAITERPRWQVGQLALQGYFGAVYYDDFQRVGGDPPDVIDDDDEQFPTLGGGALWKLGGKHVDIGLEGMLSWSGRTDVVAFVAGGGGAAVAIDLDMLIFEMYGGPFVNVFLGENWRVYGAAGPLMQWADYEQDDGTVEDNSAGFGTGVYARAGLERVIYPGAMLGVGVRWSQSTIDLGNELGDLELSGTQLLITMTQGL